MLPQSLCYNITYHNNKKIKQYSYVNIHTFQVDMAVNNGPDLIHKPEN